ncbi:MAG: hypothetical protein GY874_13805 [Desulfobacteraceae bacterium]|nr:hypothetical protein [Desulfobacteraceae bacterium]
MKFPGSGRLLLLLLSSDDPPPVEVLLGALERLADVEEAEAEEPDDDDDAVREFARFFGIFFVTLMV